MTNFDGMFRESAFDEDITGWKIYNKTTHSVSMRGMFSGTAGIEATEDHDAKKFRASMLKHLHCKLDICDKTFRTIRTYVGLQISCPQDTKYGLF